ncbi:hypothetical protein RMATCC62417_14646 [Rhizopus microsporus]|nr:hypothetical protein RMATCC62417_14646 [Rhizopus microsporus]
MNPFHEDGRGGIVDYFGKEAAALAVDPSFRLTNLMNLCKYIKNNKVALGDEEIKDTDTQEAPNKKKRITTYNIYTNEDRLQYFFIQEKLMRPTEAAKLANVNS